MLDLAAASADDFSALHPSPVRSVHCVAELKVSGAWDCEAPSATYSLDCMFISVGVEVIIVQRVDRTKRRMVLVVIELYLLPLIDSLIDCFSLSPANHNDYPTTD